MNQWRTFYSVINDTKIRLDTLDQDGETAGWIVRRACNVFQAYLPPARPVTDENGQGQDAVVNLLNDGRLLGQAGNADDARTLVEDALDIDDSQTVPALNVAYMVEHGDK